MRIAYLLLPLVAIALVVLMVVLFRRDAGEGGPVVAAAASSPERMEREAREGREGGAEPSGATVRIERIMGSAPLATAMRDAPAARASAPSALAKAKADLSSARAAVDTQLRLLRVGDDQAFLATFLPSVSVTPEQIERCRGRVSRSPILPDWEKATDAVEGGHRVRRVSMFGKGETGFHEVDGRWLADDVWCAPQW